MNMTKLITKEEFLTSLSVDTKTPIDNFVLETLVEVKKYGIKSYFLLSDDGVEEPTSISYYRISADTAFEMLAHYVEALENKKTLDLCKSFSEYVADIRMQAIDNEEELRVNYEIDMGGLLQ